MIIFSIVNVVVLWFAGRYLLRRYREDVWLLSKMGVVAKSIYGVSMVAIVLATLALAQLALEEFFYRCATGSGCFEVPLFFGANLILILVMLIGTSVVYVVLGYVVDKNESARNGSSEDEGVN